VGDNGKGILEENDIHENGGGEVHISTYANPMLRKNHIHNSPESGVKVFEHGRGTLRSNHVNFNSGPNVHVTTKGAPDLVSNQIMGSPISGVLVEKLGGGRYHGNQILNNQMAVHVMSEAAPNFHTNN
jgi:F-box protein 11